MTLASAVPHATLQANKRLLRKSVSAACNALQPPVIQAQSKEIAARVLALPAFQASKAVSCYLSMPTGEVDTSSLVLEILRAGKSLFVPKIDKAAGRMDFLRVYDEEDLRSLAPGTWGIPEPAETYKDGRRTNIQDRDSQPLDMILMPGVAFDRSLSRIGHGKGYYDKFIASYTEPGRPTPTLVGLALSEQFLLAAEIPMGEHDWPVHFVATPDEVFSSKDPSAEQGTAAEAAD